MSLSADPGPTGRIITFYSYKGGTGRTMALANVAWLLASNGYKVLTVDWDLESPGLHRYYHPFLKDKGLRSSEGILDLIRKHADTATHAMAGPPEFHGPARIQEYAMSLDWDFPGGGLIDFVPAGRQDLGYAEAVSTFDWDAFWHAGRGRQLLDALRDDMAANYDFVLIDSRTGTSDTGSICTVRLPGTVVNCFTLNTQSITGAVAITRSIISQNSGITVYPLPTRIEDGEKAKLQRGRTVSRDSFEPYLDFLGDEPSAEYWNAVEVPYIPYYAYEEVLATFGDVPLQNDRLLGPYVRLASRLAGRPCPAAAIPDGERTRVLREFEQTVNEDRRTIVVVYAPLDRIWAEWLRDRLDDATHRIILHSIRDSLPDLDALDHLVVVFSRDLINREGGPRLLHQIRDRISTGAENTVAVLRVDATVMGGRVPSRMLVDAMGASEQRVLEMMSGALSPDPSPAVPQAGGSVRYPADQPPFFQVKLTRNPRFSGRGGVIEDIRNRLLNSGVGGGRLALIGLPGVGKTQTALEYVYRFAASYDGVWWISAAQPGQVRIALADVATSLSLPGGNVEEQVAAVLEALRKAVPVRKWLVVLDNVDDPAELAELLPAGPGHILVTSRNPQWGDGLEAVDVGVFKRAESLELLGRRVQNLAPIDADRLAARVGDLPLALEQAGGWLGATGMTVADYVGLLDRSAAKTMSESPPAAYNQTVASTVGVAYDRLAQTKPAATRLIELLAFAAPEVIPYRMISNKQLTALLAPIDERMYDPARHGSLIQDLGRLGLARVDAGTNDGNPDPGKRGVVVHRLTQDIVRSRLTEAQQADRRREIQSVLAEAERGDPDKVESRAAYEAIRPHLEPSGALTSDSPATRQLIIDMARYLFVRGDTAGCQEFAEATLKEWLPLFGPDDASVLRLRRTLALALRDQGHEADAYAMNEDSLERLRRTLGDDDPYTLSAAMSFGADLRARGEYDKAVSLDEQTLRGLRAVYGDDNQDTLAAASNLAVSMRFVGNFQEAARRDRETLERRRKVLGASSLHTIGSLENLGLDLIELGDLRSARNVLEQAYDTCRTFYGEDHSRSVRVANTYSVALRRFGLVDKAVEVIDDAVGRAERSLGRQHRITLNLRLEQADVRWAEGRVQEARALGEDAFEDFQRVFGEHHPDAIAAGNDLAIFRRVTGGTDKSLSLAERTFRRLGDRFHPAHPYTVAGMITLSNAQWADGSHQVAAATDDEVLSRLRRAKLEKTHPALLAAMWNWGLSHDRTESGNAARMREEALATLVETFGSDHISTRAARDGQRVDQDIAPFSI
ncbi:FxSxx-COOH system tetratricopeptide repeat protein [Actinoplanes sp. NPDC051494]|uniref:FxSxx-COOH system tetratricopeptide repeat protein n=1 Tax=Actinoplanes sp. NPDC051494 TaxID=3363907 RepID=UPI0037B012B5